MRRRMERRERIMMSKRPEMKSHYHRLHRLLT
jgi:hypothetical protein